MNKENINLNDKNNLNDLSLLKDKLKFLKNEKGIVSRKIGLAKKSSLSIDDLLITMRELSNEYNSIKQEIDNINTHSESEDKTDENKSFNIPSQFKLNDFIDFEHSITVHLCNDMDKWNRYVNEHKNACAYHSASFKLVIEKTFELNCHYLIAEDEDGICQGVLPLTELKSHAFGHFFVSLPFFNYGGVLANTMQAKNKLLEYASDLAQSSVASHIEFRHCYEEINTKTRSDKITMLLSLPNNKKILRENMGTKLRAQIKKSKKSDCTMKVGKEELIDDFYYVFSRNMRDLGTPVYSKLFFVNIMKYIPAAYIGIVYKDSSPVSAGFVLGWRNTLEIPWASTLRKANQYSANMLLYSGLLEFAIDKQYEVFDFGRSSKDSNTYRFKKQWGAVGHPLYWHYWLPNDGELPQINPNNPKYKLFINLWKRLPLFIANFIGPHIIKNIP